MEKIVIVVSQGRVESVLSKVDIDVEIVDFDMCMCEVEEFELTEHINNYRQVMKEIKC